VIDTKSEKNNYKSYKSLLTIIAIALIARIVTALISNNINHPDENFQILEQAHRLVFGYGFIPWEYRFSARSWLMPGFIAVLLYPFKLLRLDNPSIYVPAIKIILSLLSLVFCFLAYRISEKLHSKSAGLWAAFLCAIWYEMIYFSIRPLTEVWAAALFMVSLSLALTGKSHRSLIIAGFLAALCWALRINYGAIVLGMVTIFLFKLDRGKRLIYFLSFIGGILFVGLFEFVTLGKPFISYWNLYQINRSFFMAGNVGTIYSIEFLMFLGYGSLFFFWFIILAAIPLWKSTKILLILLILLLISHILIPAKKHELDYRNIFIAIPIILTIGGIVIAKLNEFFRNRKNYILIQGLIILLLSLAGAFVLLPGQRKIYAQKPIDVYKHNIFYSNPHLDAYGYLYNTKNLHGIYDGFEIWFKSGGYYHLHRNVPIYFNSSPPSSPDYVSHILTMNKTDALKGFNVVNNFSDVFIYARTDSLFKYRKDKEFSFIIFQTGVDDRFDPDDFR